MNLAAIIDQAARCRAASPAIVFNGRSITYAALNRAVDRVAALVRRLGLDPGDRVALLAPNRPEWVAAYYGVIRAGGVAVCLSAAYRRVEIDHLLRDCRARLLITAEALRDQVSDISGLPGLEEILSMDHEPLASVFDDQGPGDSGLRPVDAEADDACAILYTGGTTGTPKGAMLTHANILFTSQNVCYHERTSPDDRAICFMPLNHVFGGNHIMNATFYGCATLVLHTGFDMDRVLASVRDDRVTRFYAVPTVFIRMLANTEAKKAFETVTYCFSAATSMASEIVRQWKSVFGLTIHESYGMTESSSLVTFNHLYRHRIGSVGVPAGVVQVRLVDDEGRQVPTGQTGEVVISGPHVMKGYFDRPEESAAAIRDGWLHSGDIGRFDEDGYLYIVDRIKDLVISGGLNVYPSEVEEVLYTHPAVDECSVLGLPDAEYGEAVTAFIVARPGQTMDQDGLRAFCKQSLASYKTPRRFIQVEELPKSPAGKILKRRIREIYDRTG